MPFLQNDYYLNRGGGKLLHGSNWIEDVYKYDASSFYNWEQDNLPIYDLEDRTEFNWEQHGYAGSSVDGIELVVSATGDLTGPYRNYTSVSAALDALPRTLRFPVIIEVAVSGELGDIEIEDFEFTENGGLEIINRCFTKVLTGSGANNDASTFGPSATGNADAITDVSSVDVSTTMLGASAMAASLPIDPLLYNNYSRAFVRTTDFYQRGILDQNAYGVAGVSGPANTLDARPGNITVGVRNGPGTAILDTTPNNFKLDTNYTANAFDYGYGGGSVWGHGLRDNSLGTALNSLGATARVAGFLYANKANSIKVKNCNGRIYLRGFCVDGVIGSAVDDNPASFDKDEGLIVENSNVVIENCAVMRCNKAGAKFINSDVILNRGFTAYRNYHLADAATVNSTDAFGIQAFDSTITLSATNDLSAGWGIDSPFTVSHNRTGIQLNNSTIKTPWGGRGYDMDGAAVAVPAQIPYRQICLDVMRNYNIGLELNNSNMDMYHSLMVYENLNGVKATNSHLKLDELLCDHNYGIGLDSDNSTIEYYRTLHGKTSGPNKILSFLKNGQNMKLVNSTFKEPDFHNFTSQGMFNYFEIEGAGYSKVNNSVYPGVALDNSVCRLLSVDSFNGTVNTTDYATEMTPVLGSAYRADSNSYLKFMGVSGVSNTSGATYITGPSSNYESKLHTVAVYANNNSVVEFNGPTILNNAGINAGANNNSTIQMLPHNENGLLEVAKYNLSDTDMHTKMVAQSYKACFAANNNSTILMKDCGDYIPYWTKSTNTYVTEDLIASSTYNPADIQGISQYVSGGYVQFFPNPILDHDLSTLPFFPKDAPLTNGYPPLDTSNIGVAGAGYYQHGQGGYCVRADKGSEVKVKNVHFPCGFLNPSSTILDVSAGLSSAQCGKIFIWGIGDDSRLHASHIVVSGNYPEEVDYNGPSGVYVSAGECDGLYIPLSAAPSSTPDTGRLSICDSFGMRDAYAAVNYAVSAIDPISVWGGKNKGPFRIYFSVNPVAKFLGYTRGTFGTYQTSSNLDAGFSWTDPGSNISEPSAVEVGEPYQELAQGYNPSRDCSTPDPTNLSDIYQEVGFQNTVLGNGYQPLSTTFFYASGMLDPSYMNRIWLDDSAMNTFANAKNATKGTSGRPKLVSYYRATTNKYGEGYSGSGSIGTGTYRSDYGLGFKSSNIFDFEDNV